MKLASRFFGLAREILAVSVGDTEHPGVPAECIKPLAFRIAHLADAIQGLLPRNAINLHATANRLRSQCRAVGLSPDYAHQLARYIAEVGGVVALHEPEEADQ
nr:hypothetical protein [Azospirillum argentinense]